MKKDGTYNFYDCELREMEEHPSEKVKNMAGQVPFHLQYLREGNPDIKPGGENNVKGK